MRRTAKPIQKKAPYNHWPTVLIALVFLAIVEGAVLAGRMPLWVIALYLGGSLITFCIYAWDKAAAVKANQRISEANLHFLAIIGGWPGALLAQQFLRHKTIKQPFRFFFWVTVAVNIVALICAFTPEGRAVMGNIWNSLMGH